MMHGQGLAFCRVLENHTQSLFVLYLLSSISAAYTPLLCLLCLDQLINKCPFHVKHTLFVKCIVVSSNS